MPVGYLPIEHSKLPEYRDIVTPASPSYKSKILMRLKNLYGMEIRHLLDNEIRITE